MGGGVLPHLFCQLGGVEGLSPRRPNGLGLFSVTRIRSCQRNCFSGLVSSLASDFHRIVQIEPVLAWEQNGKGSITSLVGLAVHCLPECCGKRVNHV